MSLRDEQRELTRQKIVGAVLAMVADGGLDELSVPAVSRRSGVSLATIYRYFPTKDELIAAAAQEPMRRALSSGAVAGDGDDDFMGFQRAMWKDFSGNLPLLRHQIASQAGREMRAARTASSAEMVRGYIEGFGVDPDSAGGQRLVSLVLLLSGSLGLVELHDRQGLSVDAALEVSLWAVRALIDATVAAEAADHPRGRNRRRSPTEVAAP